MSLIGLLTSRIAGPVASFVAVILLAVALSQCSARHAAERQLVNAERALVNARRDLGTCRANTAALEGAVVRQNAAVAAWKAEGEARAAEVAKARLAARKEADRADHAARLLSQVTPAGNDVCSRLLSVDAAVKEIAR